MTTPTLGRVKSPTRCRYVIAESEFADHQISFSAASTSSEEGTLSRVRCWPAKLASAPSSSAAEERTASGQGRDAIDFLTCSIALSSPDATSSTIPPARATPGGSGIPPRAASPRPTAFEPKSESSSAFSSGTTASNSEPHFAGVAVDGHLVALRNPVGALARADHSRDPVLAGDDRSVREQAAAVRDDRPKQRQEDVERLGRRLGNEHVALLDPVELGRSRNTAGRTLVGAAACREPSELVLLVLLLGAAEHRVDHDHCRAHHPRDSRR